MKKTIYLITLFVLLIGCNNHKEIKTNNNSTDTTQKIATNKSHKNIFIKDESLYDKAFIEGIEEYKEQIKIIDNYIITGTDTTYFPNDLLLNKDTHFKGKKDANYYLLTVKRINLTTIIYNFEIIKNNETVSSKTGKAIINSMFFIASEMDEDTKFNEGYGCYEYADNSNECSFYIRIGIGLDDNGKHRASLNLKYNDKKNEHLNIDNCPTLRTE